MLLLFGASSQLGKSIINIEGSNNVIGVSRINGLNNLSKNSIIEDLVNTKAVIKKIEELAPDLISTIIFAQRYRPEKNQIYSLENDQIINIKSPLEICRTSYKMFKNLKSITFISSIIGGGLIADEQPIEYHVVRSGIENMCRYLALEFSDKNIAVNTVRIGYVKGQKKTQRKENYYELDKITIPRGYAPDAKETAEMILKISKVNSGILTGQIITADAGLTLSAQSTLAFKIMEKMNNDFNKDWISN